MTPKLLHTFTGFGTDAQHGNGRMGVNCIQLLRRIQVAFIQADQHSAALQGGNGGDAINKIRVRHRNGSRCNDHKLIDVGRRGAGKAAFARLYLLHKTFAAAQLPNLHPVPYQGAGALPAELAASPALQDLPAYIYIVEPTQSLFNASSHPFV